jgi:hypothetical protein
VGLLVEREVAGVKDLNFRARQVFSAVRPFAGSDKGGAKRSINQRGSRSHCARRQPQFPASQWICGDRSDSTQLAPRLSCVCETV